MTVTIACPHCSTALRVAEDLTGKQVRCPKCQQVFEAAPTVTVLGDTPPGAGIVEKPLPPPVPPLPQTPAPARAWDGGYAQRPRPARGPRPPQPSSTPWGLIIGLSAGGAALLLVTVVGILLFAWTDRVQERGMIAEDAQLRADVARQQEMEARRQEQRAREDAERARQQLEKELKGMLPPGGPVLADPPQPAVPRQTIQLAKVIDAFNTAAVSHDSRAALVVFPDGKLEHFSCPDFQVKGTYRLPKEAYETALDRRGVLYAVCTEFKKGALFPRERRGTGDLYLFPVSDLLAGREAPGKQLQPSKVIPIGGLVPSLALSPAHDWLYCLDATNRKIVRVNTGQARADGELPVEAGTDAMCLTPDGKTLYTVTHGGKLQKFDVARWRLERTFEVGGACRDIQATDDGLVFINSAEGQWVNLRLLNTKTGEVVNWAGIYSSNCIRLAPDQKRLYVSCWNLSPANVTSYYISRDAPAKGRESGGCSLDANFGARGGVAVSPDGRFLFCDAGRIVRLGQ